MRDLESIVAEVVERYRDYVPASYARLIRRLRKSLVYAIQCNHRRMLVITGGEPELVGVLTAKALIELGRALKKHKVTDKPHVLYVYHRDMPGGRLRYHVARELVKRKYGSMVIRSADYDEAEEYLGTTFDGLVMDLTEDLRPNDLGRLIGVVRGGGLIVLQIPDWDEWENTLTLFQRNLATPQHPEEEVRQIFKRWVKRKLKEHKGIFIYNAKLRRTIRSWKDDPRELRRAERHISIPKERLFPVKLYKLALTQDQVEVIKLIERFVERPRKGMKRVLILTADRGRGKSCALGIGSAGLIHELLKVKHRVRILVTAPRATNVQSLMDLAFKAVRELGYDAKTFRRGGSIIEIRGDKFSIEYWEPIKIPKLKGDIVIVDEAAGLQVPMLHKIRRAHDRVLYSSTIHGYEGAGRGFSVRFLQVIRGDPSVEIIEYEMEEPIRYGLDDPIERWQFDTLLLDAEPAKLTREDLKDIEEGNLTYVEPDLNKWFSREGEKELRQFFGIYVLAHYRNEPDDLAMMADAPHHTIRAMKTRSGKIVCSVQLAEEGPIPEDMVDDLLLGGKIRGNIIPDRILKHLRIREFSETRGWRIVRIATHPEVQGRGIGSRMIECIIEEAIKRGYDWVGAGFGVNPQLLRFWLKNGFIPLHMSPDRNPVSGEFTIIVVKPLTERARKVIELGCREFKLKLLSSIHDVYKDLEPEVALDILKLPIGAEPLKAPALTPVQWDRLRVYSLGPMTYEAVCDIINAIARFYFMTCEELRVDLSEFEELILIIKVLQARSWEEAAEELNVKPIRIMTRLKDIARKFVETYFPFSERPGISLDEALRGAYHAAE